LTLLSSYASLSNHRQVFFFLQSDVQLKKKALPEATEQLNRQCDNEGRAGHSAWATLDDAVI
jgi:hypothetical protein